MKKLFIAVCFLFGFAALATAQEQPKKKEAPKATQLEKKKPAPAVKKNLEEERVPLKADGTPDKRFKINKGRKEKAAHVKKDGSPDMRYKENKKAKG